MVSCRQNWAFVPTQIYSHARSTRLKTELRLNIWLRLIRKVNWRVYAPIDSHLSFASIRNFFLRTIARGFTKKRSRRILRDLVLALTKEVVAAVEFAVNHEFIWAVRRSSAWYERWLGDVNPLLENKTRKFSDCGNCEGSGLIIITITVRGKHKLRPAQLQMAVDHNLASKFHVRDGAAGQPSVWDDFCHFWQFSRSSRRTT